MQMAGVAVHTEENDFVQTILTATDVLACILLRFQKTGELQVKLRKI